MSHSQRDHSTEAAITRGQQPEIQRARRLAAQRRREQRRRPWQADTRTPRQP